MAQIGIEDFRVMTESFGMQLDDDSLLALFSRVSSHDSIREHTLYTVCTDSSNNDNNDKNNVTVIRHSSIVMVRR